MNYIHKSVMLKEILDNIDLKKGDKVVDCTLGGAGYTSAFSVKVGSKGRVISFDLDNLAIKNAEKIIKDNNYDNITLINDSFHNLKLGIKKIFKDEDVQNFKAVVMDLGLSSAQLDDMSRGFSFLKDAPLDMTFGGSGEDKNTTQEIINNKSEKELEKIIKNYGEERFAKNIALGIIKARRIKKIQRSQELVDIIRGSIPGSYAQNSKIHFATRTFQAFRIASNDELSRLKKVLPQALDILKLGGKLAVVSFHSLEDRIVKHFFKMESRDCICLPEIPLCKCGHKAKIKIITKKPLAASKEEIKNNPRARSAKLRIAEKI